MRTRGAHSDNTRTRGTQPEQAKAGKTTICHATGAETNPYVEITVSNNALKAHGRHHDGADIIPAPEGGCDQTTAAATGEEEGAVARRVSARSVNRTVAEVTEAAAGVLGVEANSRRTRAAGGVLGATASSPGREVASDHVAEEEDEDGGSLPFTGLALIGILATALLALAGGTAARRASRA